MTELTSNAIGKRGLLVSKATIQADINHGISPQYYKD